MVRLMNEYDIEPFMPAISPGAPVPAPEFVPWKGKLNPKTTYYNHSLYRGGDPAKIFKEGLLFNPEVIDGKMTGKVSRPTAMAHPPVSKTQPLFPYGGPRTMDHVGKPHLNIDYATRSKSPKSARYGSVIIDTEVPLYGQPGKSASEGYLKKNVELLDKIPEQPKLEKGKPVARLNPKNNIAFYPKGSNTPMTKPGMVTGRMPMIRGFGGGIVDMFMEGPALQEAKTNPLVGMGNRAEIEAAYEYGL